MAKRRKLAEELAMAMEQLDIYGQWIQTIETYIASLRAMDPDDPEILKLSRDLDKLSDVRAKLLQHAEKLREWIDGG